MTDLELTKLCAEAMGYRMHKYSKNVLYNEEARDSMLAEKWNPLHDDAQAMALVKRFLLHIQWLPKQDVWLCYPSHNATIYATSENFNRAAAKCVAKMQLSRVGKNEKQTTCT